MEDSHRRAFLVFVDQLSQGLGLDLDVTEAALDELGGIEIERLHPVEGEAETDRREGREVPLDFLVTGREGGRGRGVSRGDDEVQEKPHPRDIVS